MRPLSPNGIIRTGDYILRSRLYIVRFRFYTPIYSIPITYFDIPDRVGDHFPPVYQAVPAPEGAAHQDAVFYAFALSICPGISPGTDMSGEQPLRPVRRMHHAVPGKIRIFTAAGPCRPHRI